jgi:hypothetical protein
MKAGLYMERCRGAKGREGSTLEVQMSRTVLLFLILLLVAVGGALFLANMDTEVAPQRIEQDVTNEALAQ